jgi:hypothetical protein
LIYDNLNNPQPNIPKQIKTIDSKKLLNGDIRKEFFAQLKEVDINSLKTFKQMKDKILEKAKIVIPYDKNNLTEITSRKIRMLNSLKNRYHKNRDREN